MTYSDEQVEALIYSLAELRDAVDKFIAAPKLGGRHHDALMRLRTLSRAWNNTRPLEDQLRRSVDATMPDDATTASVGARFT
jgi:hypothetical protein